MNMNNNVWWLLLPYFLFLLLLLFLPSSSSCCNHHDSSALLLFKNSLALNTTHDYNGWLHDYCLYSSKTESWKNGTDCCEWEGVTWDISGHVIELDLSCSNLEGQLHPNSTIFSLRHLQQLDLSVNHIFGGIPSTISHLSKLVSLNLHNIDLVDDPNYPRMRIDRYTCKKLIQNATNLRELYLDGVDMSCMGESSLSLLTNLPSSLVSLSLSYTKLQGNLSSDILCLPNLQHIYLDHNKDLGGELPKSNWSTPLRDLDLSHTAFSGNIPGSIGHLKSLDTLNLGGCNFDGLLPSSVFNLTQLQTLDLSFNKLVGPIPYWCYSLPSLSFLDVSNNHLTGSIDLSGHLDFHHNSSLLIHFDFSYNSFLSIHFHSTADSKFKILNHLDLSHNSFLSIIVDSTADYILPYLDYLYLSSCNINSFPKFLAQLKSLFSLDLSHNNIRGSIPPWFQDKLFSWTNNIMYIDLSFNKLQGDLPIPPKRIQSFLVSNNELTGNITSAMCHASYLQILNLAHNNLTGQIPPCLGTLPSLLALDLQKNNLHGNIPENFSYDGNELVTIKLNGNQLDRPLPRSLVKCTKLEVLDLTDNNIEDTFPHWLESLQHLQVLSLRSNKFHGVITCFGAKHPFPRLRIFDVSNNNFSGPLPASYIKNFQGMVSVNDINSQRGSKYMDDANFYNDSVVVVMKGREVELKRILTIFTTIDLSNNMFEGELPKVIGELHSLKGLNLSHNAITGTIPRSFGNLRNLEWLDLSWNHLKGEILLALINLNFLAVLNLSQNHLEGIIPTGGQFNTFENDSYVGNPMLCGSPLSKSCNEDEERPPHSTFHHEESGFGWKAVAVGYACGFLLGMLLGYNVFMNGKPQWLARLVEGVLN